MTKLLFSRYTFILLVIILFLNINIYSQKGTSINTTGTPADKSAILDVNSTSQGVLFPRMTTSQRNTIASPATSLMIFNTTTNCFEAFANGSWFTVACAPACTNPSSPIAGTHISSNTQITWNWNSVAGATGYQWNTSNTYPGAGVNVLPSTSYTQTGLTCNTSYTLYLWSYNNCGNSVSAKLTQSTTSCNCTTSIDQQQLVYNGGESARNLPGYSTWQSFTAGFTGKLVQIDQAFFVNMTGTATLNIYSGTGAGGSKLYSAGITISGTGNFWNTFIINPSVAVTSGQVYTFEIVPVQGGGLPDPYGIQVSGTADTYAGGRCDVGPTFDDVFKTYICH